MTCSGYYSNKAQAGQLPLLTLSSRSFPGCYLSVSAAGVFGEGLAPKLQVHTKHWKLKCNTITVLSCLSCSS